MSCFCLCDYCSRCHGYLFGKSLCEKYDDTVFPLQPKIMDKEDDNPLTICSEFVLDKD